jgi:hypothetical protein
MLFNFLFHDTASYSLASGAKKRQVPNAVPSLAPSHHRLGVTVPAFDAFNLALVDAMAGVGVTAVDQATAKATLVCAILFLFGLFL